MEVRVERHQGGMVLERQGCEMRVVDEVGRGTGL